MMAAAGVVRPPLGEGGFAARKQKILAQLAVPDAEYTDASPKGTVDAGIRDLIDELNGLDGFVTTSSCAGRVSVFVEGVKKKKKKEDDDERNGDDDDDDEIDEAAAAAVTTRPAGTTTTLAAIGGKGGGGNWLFVSHDPVVTTDPNSGEQRDLKEILGLKNSHEETGDEGSLSKNASSSAAASSSSRLIHFKFEPMILHVLTASPAHAQLLLRCGLQAGFRESGAINLTAAAAAGTVGETATPTPMVAIRSMGLSFESLVGVMKKEGGMDNDGNNNNNNNNNIHCTVTPAYLRMLVDIGNERFAENTRRIQRFRSAVLEAAAAAAAGVSGGPQARKMMKGDGSVWEDAEARRERKKAEGLKRKAALQNQQCQTSSEPTVADDNNDVDMNLNTAFA